MHVLRKTAACLSTLALAITWTACSTDEDGLAPFQREPGTGDYLRLESLGPVNVNSSDRQVRILVRVTDSLNIGKPELTINDFEVYENNVNKVGDLEANTRIDRESIPFIIQTAILVDISKSLEGLVPEVKMAVNNLLDNRVLNQEFAIYTFDSQVRKVQDFTTDVELLKQLIDNLPEDGLDASTNLYQAIISASLDLQDEIDVSRIVETSMIVFTDGKHNADPNLTAANAQAALANGNVFVAALNSPNLDELALQSIVGEPNFFFANEIDDLAPVFLEVQDRILSQSNSIYFITYTSPISVPGVQNLKIAIYNNSNIGVDSFADLNFSSNGF